MRGGLHYLSMSPDHSLALTNIAQKKLTTSKMYKDIISYELAENTTQEQLLQIAKRIVNEWMKKQPGFMKWEIHTDNDGRYTDIVYWRSQEDAKKSRGTNGQYPQCHRVVRLL